MNITANACSPAGPGRRFPRLLAALALAALLALPACAKTYNGYKPATDVDVFERAPVGEAVDVTSFKWNYLPYGGIQVTGKVKNNSGKALRQVTLFTMLFDENGKAVAMGEAPLSLKVIPAGGEADFKLSAATDRPTGIKCIRVLTNAQCAR